MQQQICEHTGLSYQNDRVYTRWLRASQEPCRRRWACWQSLTRLKRGAMKAGWLLWKEASLEIWSWSVELIHKQAEVECWCVEFLLSLVNRNTCVLCRILRSISCKWPSHHESAITTFPKAHWHDTLAGFIPCAQWNKERKSKKVFHVVFTMIIHPYFQAVESCIPHVSVTLADCAKWGPHEAW